MVRLLCLLRHTDLVIIRGTITDQHYVDEVTHPHVLPIYRTVGNTYFFYQDKARPHTCNMASSCMQAGHVNTLDLPSRSPDLSPIEHLCDIVSRQVRDLYPFPAATLPELDRRLVKQWQRIP